MTKPLDASRGALKGLLSTFVEREVAEVSVIENEPAISDLRDRQIRFDINTRFDDGKPANIEMTLYAHGSELSCLVYYLSRLFAGQDIKGDEGYGELKDAYQISFIVNNAMFRGDCFDHHLRLHEEGEPALDSKLHIIVLELSKLHDVIKKPVSQMTTKERWCVFLKYVSDSSKRDIINEIMDQEEAIAMAAHVLQNISKDDIERARLESAHKNRLDWQSGMVEAIRAGEAKGREEGRVEGEQIGVVKGREEVAKELLAEGMDVRMVARVAKLPEDTVSKLKAELEQ